MMDKTFAKAIAAFFASTLLGGCETFTAAETKRNSLAADSITAIQQEQALSRSTLSEQEVLNSLVPRVDIAAMESQESRFDVAVKNINAREFLLGLVEGTRYNMVVSPDVKGNITLKLKHVTINEVLAAVEKIYPLMVEQKNNIFYVSSAESMTAIYPVDYLNLTRKGKSRTNIAGQTVSGNSSGSQNQSSGNNSGQNSGQGNSVVTLSSSQIETKNQVDFWSELSESLNLLIANETNAKVIVSPHAGIVVVKAEPRTQRLIQEYLGVTQQNLNRQVILEAKIIEVTLNDGFQAGIDWTKINNVNSDALLGIRQTGQVLVQEPSINPINGVFSMVYDGTSFDAAIGLLKEQGDVQVLSSPRVSTINNQKAVIKVGSDEFFVTDVSTTTVTGTSTATSPDVTLTPFFSGISLDVTPQISQTGQIVLHIHPVVSEIQDQTKTLTLGSSDFTLPLALTTVRESDSIVKTADQQVIVIGGLMQNKIQTEEVSTPLLGDIPIIGNAFKQTREFNVKSELVILLKANLVNEELTQQQLRELKKRFNQL